MTMLDGEEYICGYPKDELMLFAIACRNAGITNEQLHDLKLTIEVAIDIVRKEVEKGISSQFKQWLEKVYDHDEVIACAEQRGYNAGYKAAYEDINRHKTDATSGYMWICPKCGLEAHSDFKTCPRCGYVREQTERDE